MASMIKKGSDVVSFLKEQHEHIRRCFEEVFSLSGAERSKKFSSLRKLLAVHETAEAEIVHPAARRVLPDGDAIVELRLTEESSAKKALSELEEFDVDSAEFVARLRALQSDVIAHTQAEESEEFLRLGEALDQSKLEAMSRAVLIAEAVAPTRPRPKLDTRDGSRLSNILYGTFAAMVDRSRDLLTKDRKS